MAEQDEFVTIGEAIRRYGRSRVWWSEQINQVADGLRSYTIPGKRGKFLKVSEIEAYIAPRQREDKENP